MIIRDILNQTARNFPSKAGLIFKDDKISYVSLQKIVFQLANALDSLGLKRSDKIAIYLPNCPQYVYSYLAGFCLGAVVVPLDFMLKTDELISCLTHSEAKILITKKKEEISFPEIKKAIPTLKNIVFIDGTDEGGGISWEALLSQSQTECPSVSIDPNDPALIMYTSGTTGSPKGILLNYLHLNGSPEAMKYFVDLTDRDVKLCALPLSHIGGLIYIQNCIHFGITLILMDRFNPFEFLRNIQDYRVTCFHIVPSMYTAILTIKEIERFDLSSLRWVVVFGAPSSPDILKRFHQYCPNANFLNGWGMTETCPPNTVTPLGSDKIESIGKPAPNCEIKIFDEQGQELPLGQVGEIVIRGKYIMPGYYKDPEATSTVKRNGWLWTGDLGKFDEEGYLYIVGRKKEMIKVGGQIVYAPEIEAVLYKHEAVAEAAVIGLSDKMRGEIVKAFVVLKEGIQVSAEELRYFAKDHLANFKVPNQIEIRNALPKNRTGKIDKEQLKQETQGVS